MHVQLKNLPPLTIPQANAIEAYFSAATLPEAAAIANTSLAEFLDTLADDAVQAHLDHAQRISTKRTTHRLTDAAHTATQVLETLAADANADPIERRRAASTILRAHRAPDSRPRRRTTRDKDPCGALIAAAKALQQQVNSNPAPSAATRPQGRSRDSRPNDTPDSPPTPPRPSQPRATTQSHADIPPQLPHFATSPGAATRPQARSRDSRPTNTPHSPPTPPRPSQTRQSTPTPHPDATRPADTPPSTDNATHPIRPLAVGPIPSALPDLTPPNPTSHHDPPGRPP